MLREVAESSLSSGQSPVLQCTLGAPSWAMLRAHRFLPALPPPGTQGRTSQANCLSSPKENAAVHVAPDNMCRLPGHSFASFKTSQLQICPPFSSQ